MSNDKNSTATRADMRMVVEALAGLAAGLDKSAAAGREQLDAISARLDVVEAALKAPGTTYALEERYRGVHIRIEAPTTEELIDASDRLGIRYDFTKGEGRRP